MYKGKCTSVFFVSILMVGTFGKGVFKLFWLSLFDCVSSDLSECESAEAVQGGFVRFSLF